MRRKLPQVRLLDLGMWVLLTAIVCAFVRELLLIPVRKDDEHGPILLVCLSFGIWFAVWSAIRTKRTGPVCQECGRRFRPDGTFSTSTVCSRCRQKSLPPAQARKEQAGALLIVIFALAIISGLACLPLWNTIAARFGGFAWVVYPLIALGASLGLVLAFFAGFIVIYVFRNWRIQFEKPSLARARKVSRLEGEVGRSGPVTIWWCAPVSPVPMVIEQLALARKRFEQLIDEPVETPPVRILVFDTRRAFAAYHQNLVDDMGGLDCLYRVRPGPTITLATEVTRLRLHDSRRSLGFGLVMSFLEAYKRFLPPNWLQGGISASLACEPGGEAREHLKRSMKAAIAAGRALAAADLFPPMPLGQFLKQLRTQADHQVFARMTQFREQSWSVFEYLAGPLAPPERLGRFRSFLSDLKANGSQEAVFQHHFGFGFDALLEQWRAWLLAQSLGDDPIPPPEIRAAILERLVPAVSDRSKKASDRIQAMRTLGSAGYVLGADALIAVLHEGDGRFTATAAWALESISGLAWGRSADHWEEWWTARDPAAARGYETAAQH
jgi:hypothetical protein